MLSYVLVMNTNPIDNAHYLFLFLGMSHGVPVLTSPFRNGAVPTATWKIDLPEFAVVREMSTHRIVAKDIALTTLTDACP